MAEGLVTGLIKQLGSTATEQVKQKIRLVVGVDKEVKKLKDNLQAVVALLNEAEKKQFTDETVKDWLEKLTDVCYEMEDVVDKWNTELIKSAIQKEEEEEEEEEENGEVLLQVCSFISSLSCCLGQVDEVSRRHDIALKIKDLNEKLDEIAIRKDRYQFKSSNEPAPKEVERPQTTSFVDVSEIYGRDSIKDDLVDMLLGKGSEERSPHLISLVGMGGIGKTTLAQLAYNDPKVKAHFEIKGWICVSNPFDQCKVAKEILESIGAQSSNLTALQSLLSRICDKVRGKKFLLVFDDVWIKDYAKWKPFRDALKNCGSQNSRIIVTTRQSRLAEMMRSANTINLEELSKEDCWLVFSKIAFFNRDPSQCEQLEGLGRQIVGKCRGLPLAAKTLGSLMQFKSSIEDWRRVLHSNLWELEDEEIKSLYAPLLLSYYDLPSPLRRCFSFCAVFPKDYVFSIDELVFMWMAQGYIESKKKMEIEIIARYYFETLAIRSFFQDFEKDENEGKIKKCKMHDIVHDFAQLISKNECFTINSDKDLGVDYKNARHLHLKFLENAQFPESIYSAKNLRTLIFKLQCRYNLSTFFQHFRYLRILTLDFSKYGGCYSMLTELPDAVGNFIHLRYLYINYGGDALPETICNLCNLQILHIKYYGWTKSLKLPQGMDKLINLRHFMLDCDRKTVDRSYINFPRGFGRLTSLRTLTYFSVNCKNDSERCKLGELRNLDHLQGTLEIDGLGKVDQCEAVNAQLKKKINLRSLKLLFSAYIKDLEEIRRGMDALVLNALEPPPNLEDLSISYYKGPTMPPWMVSLKNLKKLYFEYLSHLPPLGKLPVLESLRIRWINGLKTLGVEFMGIEESEKNGKDNISIMLFPNLISLEFYELNEWEDWNGIEGEEDYIRRFTIMPRLRELKFWECAKLKSLPNFLRTTPLQKLTIFYCPILEECYKRGTREEWPKISHIPDIDNETNLFNRLQERNHPGRITW